MLRSILAFSNFISFYYNGFLGRVIFQLIHIFFKQVKVIGRENDVIGSTSRSLVSILSRFAGVQPTESTSLSTDSNEPLICWRRRNYFLPLGSLHGRVLEYLVFGFSSLIRRLSFQKFVTATGNATKGSHLHKYICVNN